MKNVLCCSVPTISLLNKMYGTEPSLGALAVFGSLKNQANPIFVDSNMCLNRYRLDNDPDEFLPESEFAILTDVNELCKYMSGDLPSALLDKWVAACVDSIYAAIDGRRIDAIAFSLERRTMALYPQYVTLSFALILRHSLTAIPQNVKFYIGGKKAIADCKNSGFIEDIEQKLPYLLPDIFVTGNMRTGLFELIEEQFPLLNVNKGKFLKGEQTSKGDNLLWRPVNYKDGDVSLSDIFQGTSVASQHPVLLDKTPYNMDQSTFTVGCQFKCSFCPSGPEQYFNSVRITKIVDLIEQRCDDGISDFRFFNNNINFDQKWTYEFCNEIIRRNIKIRWSDSANMRIGDRDMFFALAEAGCIKLWYGTETMSTRILRQIKKYVTTDRIDDVLTWAHDAGIWNSTNIIVNFPGETLDEYQLVKQFMSERLHNGKINGYQINAFMLLRDTEYHTNPDRFGIEILDPSATQGYYSYNEIGMDSWPTVRDRGIDRTAELNALLSGGKATNPINSEYLIFALYRLLGDKKQIINIMKDIVHAATHDDGLDQRLRVTLTEASYYKDAANHIMTDNV